MSNNITHNLVQFQVQTHVVVFGLCRHSSGSLNKLLLTCAEVICVLSEAVALLLLIPCLPQRLWPCLQTQADGVRGGSTSSQRTAIIWGGFLSKLKRASGPDSTIQVDGTNLWWALSGTGAC